MGVAECNSLNCIIFMILTSIDFRSVLLYKRNDLQIVEKAISGVRDAARKKAVHMQI